MADENKIDQKPDALENLSPEELRERIQEEKKNAKRSLRFAFTALIAIIAVCIAWFAANNKVTMTGTQISAENSEPFEIASVGNNRLSGETTYLKDDDGQLVLSEGTKKTYDGYIDILTGDQTITTSPWTYYTGGSGVAWHMTGEQSLVPGAGGKLDFYLIPKKSGLTQAVISLNLEGYKLVGDDKNKKVEKVDNSKIQNLLNGHILLFQHVDDTYGYSGWLGENKTFTVKAPGGEKATFTPDTPYKVTVYWKWPQYFRNYIYTQRSAYGDLFTDAASQEDGSDYKKLNTFVNAQKEIKADSGKLFYNASATDTTETISGEINNTMSDETLNACSTYYNQADEYIGTNTQYVYVQVNVN